MKCPPLAMRFSVSLGSVGNLNRLIYALGMALGLGRPVINVACWFRRVSKHALSGIAWWALCAAVRWPQPRQTYSVDADRALAFGAFPASRDRLGA